MIKKEKHMPEFLSLDTTDIWGWKDFVITVRVGWGGAPCVADGQQYPWSLPTRCPPVVPSPKLWPVQPQMFPDIANCPLAGAEEQNHPVENHWHIVMLLYNLVQFYCSVLKAKTGDTPSYSKSAYRKHPQLLSSLIHLGWCRIMCMWRWDLGLFKCEAGRTLTRICVDKLFNLWFLHSPGVQFSPGQVQEECEIVSISLTPFWFKGICRKQSIPNSGSSGIPSKAMT